MSLLGALSQKKAFDREAANRRYYELLSANSSDPASVDEFEQIVKQLGKSDKEIVADLAAVESRSYVAGAQKDLNEATAAHDAATAALTAHTEKMQSEWKKLNNERRQLVIKQQDALTRKNQAEDRLRELRQTIAASPAVSQMA